MNNYIVFAQLIAISFLAACNPGDPQQADEGGRVAADLVLTGGKFFTVDDDNPWAQAVAIKGDKFVYVGDDDGAAAFVSGRMDRTLFKFMLSD